MNNPKLTNILLIVLIVSMLYFLQACIFASPQIIREYMASNQGFRGRKHGSFGNFHRGFEAYRGNYGGFAEASETVHRGMDGGCKLQQ